MVPVHHTTTIGVPPTVSFTVSCQMRMRMG